ncbi:MAG: pilus assembly protein PilM [bacterium]|nr:pilus assembly protein PilM [bacterium]
MPFTKSILGLDIGSHAIKAVEIHPSLRGTQAGQMRLHPRAAEPDELPETLERFVKLHHLDVEHVVSAIEGLQISLRRLEFPFRDNKKLAQAVPFAVEGEIPFELEDIVIDWTNLGGTGGKSEILAALTRRDNVSSRLSQLQAAGIQPRVLEAEGLVLGNLTSLFDLPGRRLLVDLGHRKTSFCLLVDGRAVSAHTIPVAGAGFTAAIAKARGCSTEEAEQIKCETGAFASDRTGMLPEAQKLIGRISREIIRFLESNQGQTIASDEPAGISEITIMGGTSKLAGLGDAIAANVGIPVVPLGDPLESEHGEIVAGGDPALFAQAIALALRSTSHAKTQLNFRQDEFAYRTNYLQILSQDLRPTAILAAVTAVIALLSFGTSLALESSRARNLEKRAQELYSQVLPGTPSGSLVPAMSRALREAQDRADFLGIYGTDLSAVDLLAELSRRIPPDVKVKFEDINIDRRTVKIKVLGESYQSADRLKSLLAKSPPFSDAQVDKVKSTRGGAGKRFNLTLSLGADGEPS